MSTGTLASRIIRLGMEGWAGMPVRSSGLALLAIAGTAIGLTACSAPGAGKTATPAAAPATASAAGGAGTSASLAVTGTAAGIPAGYHRVGGPAQGISLAVPQSWVPINLASEKIDEAARKLQLRGMDVATVEHLMQATLAHHPILAFDVASSVSDPQHFARNLNAFCSPSGLTDTGSAGIPVLKEAVKSEFATVASDITQRDITVGGVPGIETSYKLNSASGLDVRESQLEVLPKPDLGCFVTLSYSSSEGAGKYLAIAAATAEFP